MATPRLQFPKSDSELAGLIEDFDWSKTAVGPLHQWPASLTAITGFMLRSPVAMVMLWGPDGVMVYNDAYAIFAGGRHPDQLGKKVVSEGWPEVAEFNANVLKVGLSGGALSYRDQELTLYRHGEAEQVWMDLDYSPVYSDDGEPAGVMAIVVETTERVAGERQRETLEAAMHVETERVQLGLDAGAVVGTWIWEVPDDRLTADRRFAETFELDVELCRTGLPMDQVLKSIHPNDRPNVDMAIADALRRGGRYRCEYRIRNGEGYAWVEANGRVQLALDGTPLRFPGVLIDVSARKAEEEARLASEARLRLVIDGAKDHAILATDARGKITTWSPGAAAIFGWSEDEIVGQPAAVLFTPEDREAGADKFELATAAAEGVAPDERWHIRKDGRRVYMNGSVHPLPADGDGQPQGFLKIARDETERRRNDEALQQLNADLERKVIERTQTRGTIWQVSRIFSGPSTQKAISRRRTPPGARYWAGLKRRSPACLRPFAPGRPGADARRIRPDANRTTCDPLFEPLPLQRRRVSLDFMDRRSRRWLGLLQWPRHNRRSRRRDGARPHLRNQPRSLWRRHF